MKHLLVATLLFICIEGCTVYKIHENAIRVKDAKHIWAERGIIITYYNDSTITIQVDTSYLNNHK